MTAAPDQRRVFELRIHGVNNTTPSSMLDRPECQIEQIEGDKLGSFWQVLPDRLPDRMPGDNGYVPAEVHREAYSWGGMARNSPGAGGTGVPSTVMNAAGRIGWVLLLPFGLANVAYWSRALPEAPPRQEPGPARWWAGWGAAAIRVFGLGLTILLISTICEVALDLFAIQCYQPEVSGSPVRVQMCNTLPAWLDPLANTGVATRLGYASLLPVLVLLGLWFLATRSRLYYEKFVRPTPDNNGSNQILAKADLWQGSNMVRGLTQLHIAAGFAVIVIASAWPVFSGTSPSGAKPQFGAVLVAAFVLLAATIVLVCLRARDVPDVTGEPDYKYVVIGTWVVLIATVLLLGLQMGLLHWHKPGIIQEAGGQSLPGIGTVPALVVAVLVGIAASALAWRASPKYSGIVGIPITAGLVGIHCRPWWGIAAVVVGFALVLVLARRLDEDTRHATAWAGMAPGLLLGLSLLVALTLSTLVVVGARSWLSRSAGTAMARPADLRVAPVYVWFGAGMVVTVGLVFLLVIVLIVVMAFRDTRGQAPQYLPPDGGPGDIRIVYFRNSAALAHRAEPVIGIVAALGLAMAAIAAGGTAVPADWWPATGALACLGICLASLATAVTAAVAAAIVLAVSGTGLLKGRRPLGLVWDLLCFLPRAAHPFAPPCYAERAVPEITDRVRKWLAVSEKRSVVLSAHSLGAVLAVAVVFTLTQKQLESVKLLTYGVQLRPYFGRIFPDFLGPAVLGTRPCRAATLWAVDPWQETIEYENGANPPAPDSVRSRLGNRWTSLWRRTDYLGFPAFGYQQANNSVDQPAEETQQAGAALNVATHSAYPRTAAYQEALNAMTV